MGGSESLCLCCTLHATMQSPSLTPIRCLLDPTWALKSVIPRTFPYLTLEKSGISHIYPDPMPKSWDLRVDVLNSVAVPLLLLTGKVSFHLTLSSVN